MRNHEEEVDDAPIGSMKFVLSWILLVLLFLFFEKYKYTTLRSIKLTLHRKYKKEARIKL